MKITKKWLNSVLFHKNDDKTDMLSSLQLEMICRWIPDAGNIVQGKPHVKSNWKETIIGKEFPNIYATAFKLAKIKNAEETRTAYIKEIHEMVNSSLEECFKETGKKPDRPHWNLIRFFETKEYLKVRSIKTEANNDTYINFESVLKSNSSKYTAACLLKGDGTCKLQIDKVKSDGTHSIWDSDKDSGTLEEYLLHEKFREEYLLHYITRIEIIAKDDNEQSKKLQALKKKKVVIRVKKNKEKIAQLEAQQNNAKENIEMIASFGEPTIIIDPSNREATEASMKRLAYKQEARKKFILEDKQKK